MFTAHNVIPCGRTLSQADSTAQQFTREQLKPAAKKAADTAEAAAGQFRSRAEDAANYVDEQGDELCS